MSPMRQMCVGIVHPAPLVRFGLAEALSRATRVAAIVAGDDLEDVLSHRPALLICDVLTPTRTAAALIANVRSQLPACKIVFLSTVRDGVVVGALLAAGADGYVLKTEPLERVVEAIELVAFGRRYVPPGIAIGDADAHELLERFDRLTKREREVFELLLQGRSNIEIAQRLFLSIRTVEQHHHRINEKLGTTAVANAIRHGPVYQLLEVMRLPRTM